MGIKITVEDAKEGITQENRNKMFPSFKLTSKLDEITIISPKPKKGEEASCESLYEVFYDTDFAISASDASTISDLIELSKGLIDLSSNPTTIINGLSVVNKAINKAINTESKTASQQLTLYVTPCEIEGKQCYEIDLTVQLKAIVTDSDPSDKDEKAEVKLSLNVFKRSNKAEYKHKKSPNKPVETEKLTVSLDNIEANSGFTVIARLDEEVSTDGPGVIGRDSISMVRIDWIKLAVRSKSCPTSIRTNR